MKKHTIIVSGLACTYPLGGVAWDYIQYLHGFHRLGHDVYYLEDTGGWAYDPHQVTFTDDYSYHIAYIRDYLKALDPDLAGRFCVRDPSDNFYGLTREELAGVVARATAVFNISTTLWLREEYQGIPVKVLIDSDPMYTQADIPRYLAGQADEKARKNIDHLKLHDRFFTFAENFGQPGCIIPKGIFDWRPTRQPIVLDAWNTNRPPASQAFTTVLSWQPKESGPEIEGRRYGGKNMEFQRFMDLPKKTSASLELALGQGRPPREELTAKGWNLKDGFAMSETPWKYRDYIWDSFAEFSLAKNAYVASGSGWFSCRSACYLAAGRPCVVQDTGFSKFMPTGEGILAFGSEDEALAGIEKVRADWPKHSRRARELAGEWFDSDKVLAKLLQEALE
jgi:hypothetical protein